MESSIVAAKDFFQNLTPAAKTTVTEVLWGLKQLAALIMITSSDGETMEGLYRPEMGVKLSIDPRIPKPQELYRDCAYSQVDRLLEWNVCPPVVPWALDETDKGVVRPYWPQAKNLRVDELTRTLNSSPEYWTKVAVLDYICAVVDRELNDVLVVNGVPQVVDSGLSFVKGEKFPCQSFLVRKYMKDIPLGKEIVRNLSQLSLDSLSMALIGLVPSTVIPDVLQRSQKLLKKGCII